MKTSAALVIGAGIGGLAVAARLAQAGLKVHVLERHAMVGGKMRTLPSPAGPVDAGPTVLTMRWVFEELFESLGETLSDHVPLHRQSMIARHFWPDGSTLDLYDDPALNEAAIADFAGATAARQFRAFSSRAKALFEAFDAPVMTAPTPSLLPLVGHVMAKPWLIPKMAPMSTLAQVLDRAFDDPRLAQLFGRYATYVGGSPYQSPGLLSLIWHAEERGVWVVDGGMHQLARALRNLAEARGAEFSFDCHVSEITTKNGKATGAILADGRHLAADIIAFNGDPRALATGLLGKATSSVAAQTRRLPRSLSAEVCAFAATPHGPELAHHNVFFRDHAKPEFDALERGELLPDPTVYLCAMDRGLPGPVPALERFETIANAPPVDEFRPDDTPEEATPCPTRTVQMLKTFGLTLTPEPTTMTTPAGFNALFPGTNGSLYGQSPHGMTASLRRPTARTALQGLYLVGGGAHPGAGVPMATLSARHAAAAILSDQTSISPSRQTVTPGGMSTGSRMVAAKPSPSSGS
ncbi:MAG: 1-hydroxycarotenoid 3,4-desaturase CrtD [Pseudomonadota bacterium]